MTDGNEHLIAILSQQRLQVLRIGEHDYLAVRIIGEAREALRRLAPDNPATQTVNLGTIAGFEKFDVL